MLKAISSAIHEYVLPVMGYVAVVIFAILLALITKDVRADEITGGLYHPVATCYGWGGEHNQSSFSRCDLPAPRPTVVEKYHEKVVYVDRPVETTVYVDRPVIVTPAPKPARAVLKRKLKDCY